MLNHKVNVINKLGLHARPAAKLTQKANEFLSQIELSKGERTVNAKSIMGVMLLAAAYGSELILTVDGADEEEAMVEISQLFVNGFGEEIDA